MRKLFLVSLLVMLSGCVSEEEIADRVIKRREVFESLKGTEIVSFSGNEYETIITLSDKRIIKIVAHKRHHTIEVGVVK